MEKNKFSATVNDTTEFDDLQSDGLDILPTGQDSFHLLKDGVSATAEVLEADFLNKRWTIRINGSNYRVQIADPLDRLVKELGLGLQIGQKVSEIKAPMPGLVLEIAVSEGQSVAKGDPMIILEAMKMENVIKCPGEGVVKAISVKQGDAVEKGAILIELD